jgi:hypothetical protein
MFPFFVFLPAQRTTAIFDRDLPAQGPGIPEPSEGIPLLEVSGHRIPCGHRVVGNSVLGGLHHEYRLEKMAA